MSTTITIAIDAMGGDHSPMAQLQGADRFARKQAGSEVFFQLYGNEQQLLPLLEKFPKLKACSEVVHTDVIIAADEKPSRALRQGRKSSMGMAINAVAKGKAEAVVSAGNTGALMAMSKIMLKTLPTIDRPAIISYMPTKNNSSVVMLDLGANTECNAQHLFQFAVMGNSFAETIAQKTEAKIALLNIGSEEMKGRSEIIQAADMLKNTTLPLNFVGYVEGNDIISGKVDVVVCDGFTGNVALKSIEGAANVVKSFVKDALQSSLWSKIGSLLLRRSLKKMAKKIDPRRYNGAMLIGLNGISIKSHGSADKIAFYNSLRSAEKLVRNNINAQIQQRMQSYDQASTLDTSSNNVSDASAQVVSPNINR